MSRKLESINTEVGERKGTPTPTWEVIISSKRSIGTIEQEEGHYHTVSSKTNHSLYFKTLESVINGLFSHSTLYKE